METWQQTDENAIMAEIKTYGYELLHNRRKDRVKELGGGVLSYQFLLEWINEWITFNLHIYENKKFNCLIAW